jgi:hypothetical protein
MREAGRMMKIKIYYLNPAGRRGFESKNFPMRPPIVSLGLYGGSRTQENGGKLNLFQV